jgi:hypothetical protein
VPFLALLDQPGSVFKTPLGKAHRQPTNDLTVKGDASIRKLQLGQIDGPQCHAARDLAAKGGRNTVMNAERCKEWVNAVPGCAPLPNAAWSARPSVWPPQIVGSIHSPFRAAQKSNTYRLSRHLKATVRHLGQDLQCAVLNTWDRVRSLYCGADDGVNALSGYLPMQFLLQVVQRARA